MVTVDKTVNKTMDKILVSENLTTILSSASLTEANALMREKRIRHLPVIDKSEYVIGLISNRDLASIENFDERTVLDIMSIPVECVHNKESVRTVILKMLEKKISSVLIVDDDGLVMGIITTDDLLSYFADNLKDQGVEPVILKARELQFIGEMANKLSTIGI